WDNLQNGTSCLSKIESFPVDKFSVNFAGEIKNFDPKVYLGQKGLRNLDRSSLFLMTAAKLAIDEAMLNITDANTDEIGVATGTTFPHLWSMLEFDKEVLKEGLDFSNPALFPSTVLNAASSQVSIRFNIQGFNTTISTGYTSSIEAIKYAFYFLKLGRVQAVVVGSVESISLVNFSGFYALDFLAGIKGEELSCPFDKRRNGIILGEGAGVVILENENHAKQRKANIYAEIKGAVSFFDAYKIGKYQPQGKGLKLSIEKALRDSHLTTEQIDCVEASANSVKEHDRIESKVLREVLGRQADRIPVTAVKSMLGESFSAAGLFQIIASLGNITEGFIPPVINYKEKDLNCGLNYVVKTLSTRRVSNVLISSFGPGGNNAALLLTKYQ
ncbi:MAG: beta-ketoacyl-[acyl-carrier-protein] synthase family protein, partial [Candidatus Omnitrophica bacterium]|nr:beta-ketoacyl-[acyl-carrier-protein] synthase family protein [Candidatus Omnitrophota bacterium]